MIALEAVSADRLPPPRRASREAADAINERLPGRCSVVDQDRLSYARDMWPRAIMWIREGRIPPPPDVVAWPRSEEEIITILDIAREREIPIIPFGAGSGVCGGTLAVNGGIALDVKFLDRVEPVDRDRLTVDAQAGVIGEVLERKLEAEGFTLGHFPSSIYMSTLGGWMAARSAGQLSNRYGKIEDMVLSLRAITGRSTVIQTPERPFRGPDLAQILIGSEGTLCVFTQAKLRVHPAPEHRAFRGFRFRSVAEGVDAMRLLFRAGLRPAVVRLYDPFDTAIVGKDKPHPPKTPPSLRNRLERDLLPAALRKLTPRALGQVGLMNKAAGLFDECLLILVFEGETSRTRSEDAHATALLSKLGGKDLGEAPARHWWKRRYAVSFKMSKLVDSNLFVDTMEVATTWDRVLDVYERVRAAVSPYAFVLCHFSHAYLEGCSLYFSFASSGTSPQAQSERYTAMWKHGLAAAMNAGATVSHHHGVGLLKADALGEQLGGGKRVLSGLKAAFDPSGILNPGKLGL